MKHEKTTEKKSTKHHTLTHEWFSLYIYCACDCCFGLFVYSARFAYAFSASLPHCLFSFFFFFSLFFSFHFSIGSYLGIFLKSAFLFNGFGVNQISNNFSTPSKKCGLLMFSFSAIVCEFSILIDFSEILIFSYKWICH